MRGLLVPAGDASFRVETLEEMGVSVRDTINAFGNRVILVDDLQRASLVDNLANAEGAEMIDGAEAEELRKLANSKPRGMNEREATAYREGYARLAERRRLGFCNAAAHKAWVTTFAWRAQIHRAEFTHLVRVTFEVGGQRTTVEDRAVSEAHAGAVVRKIRREQAKKLGGKSVFVTKSITPIQSAPPARSRARDLGRQRIAA